MTWEGEMFFRCPHCHSVRFRLRITPNDPGSIRVECPNCPTAYLIPTTEMKKVVKG